MRSCAKSYDHRPSHPFDPERSMWGFHRPGIEGVQGGGGYRQSEHSRRARYETSTPTVYSCKLVDLATRFELGGRVTTVEVPQQGGLNKAMFQY